MPYRLERLHYYSSIKVLSYFLVLIIPIPIYCYLNRIRVLLLNVLTVLRFIDSFMIIYDY